MAKRLKGIFITFEGSEGSGKSTQAKLLSQYLRKKKKSVLFVREPGGVKISEAIREILLDPKNKKMTNECETLLYMAARSQLIEEVISKAIKKGTIVICDRFLDSTVAYQGYGNGVSIDLIEKLGKFITRGINPDVTFIMDMEASKGLSRAGKQKDRIEQRSLKYHQKVRNGYLEIARRETKRIKVIKADDDRKVIQEQIREIVQKRFKL